MSAHPGLFITLEGADGVGKSTQCTLLAERLQREGYNPVVTREPGGTEGADRIRELLLNPAQPDWSPMAELLLFCAARRDHCERRIQPALNAGQVVLCDRFHDSTEVYQSVAGGADVATTQLFHEHAIGLIPDVTIVLLLDPQLAAERSHARGADDCRFESRGDDFRSQVEQGYRTICEREPDRCFGVDASQSAAEVADQIWDIVEPCLKPKCNHPTSNASPTQPSA